MKQFEDRAWEAMKIQLDVALPVDRKRKYLLWWLALPLLLIGTLSFIFMGPSDSAGKPPMKLDNIDKIQPKSVEVEGVTASTCNENNSKRIALDDSKLILNSKPIISGNFSNHLSHDVASADISRPRNKTFNVENTNSNAINTNELNNSIKIDKNSAENEIVLTHVDDQSNINDNKLHGESNQNNRSLDNSNSHQSNFTLSPLENLNADGIILDELIFDVNKPMIKILKNKYPHTFAIILNGGGYAERKTEYSGAFLRPELRYKISSRSSLFMGFSSRIRFTKEDAILTDYNSTAEKYINVNNLTSASLDQISIDDDNINSKSFDIGLDLGYRFRATPRVSFSGLGFFRRNNVFKNKLINNLQSGNNYGNYFDARTKISSNIKNLNQNFVYGAGIDAKYSVGSRSEFTLGFNGAFNQFNNYEFSLGYGFRIY
ncbi:MAG: hypothetical protein WAR99_13705 [Saprospiraceae bacterium]